MSTQYIVDKNFVGIDFTKTTIELGEYEGCSFSNCHFLSVDLSHLNFIDCVFTNCDLSLTKLNNTALRDVKFVGCKLLGLHFDDCNKFSFSAFFEGCNLNLSSFYKMNMKNSQFKSCSLHEVDFIEANLTSSIFDVCDLMGASFDRTVLEKADFRTSRNFIIDPEKNKLKKAKFSVATLPGLLEKYNLVIE